MVSLRGRWHTRLRRRGGATLCGPSCSARGGRCVRIWTRRAPRAERGAGRRRLSAPLQSGRAQASQPPSSLGGRKPPSPFRLGGPAENRSPRSAPLPASSRWGEAPVARSQRGRVREEAGAVPAAPQCGRDARAPGPCSLGGLRSPRNTLWSSRRGAAQPHGRLVRLYQIGRTSATRGAQAMTLRSTPRAVASSSTTSSRSSQGP